MEVWLKNTIVGLALFQFLMLGNIVYSQKIGDTDEAFEATYRWRVKQKVLYGTYIPFNMTDAFNELNKKIDENSKIKLASLTENELERKLFFGLQRWIIHNWGFYGGSRLSVWINENLKIYHPEEMASIIIIAYHRNLNKRALNMKQLVDYFHKKQEEKKKERLESGKVIYEEIRQVPRP